AIPISGTSQATSTESPNIDFYLLLDDSPSMAIAATTAGINTLTSETINAPNNSADAGGCGFGCHETNPQNESGGMGTPANVACTNGSGTQFPSGGEDNYALARCLS